MKGSSLILVFLVAASAFASDLRQYHVEQIADYLRTRTPYFANSKLKETIDKFGIKEAAKVLEDALKKNNQRLGEVRNEYGNILHGAAGSYDGDALTLVLANFPDDAMAMLFDKNLDDETPLHSALEQELPENIDKLLCFAQDRKNDLVGENPNTCIFNLASRGSIRRVLQKHYTSPSGTELKNLELYCLKNGKEDLPQIVGRLVCQCTPLLMQQILSSTLKTLNIPLNSVGKKGRNSVHKAVREVDAIMLKNVLDLASRDEIWALLSARDVKGRTGYHYAMMDNSVPRLTGGSIEIDDVVIFNSNPAFSDEHEQQDQIIRLLRDSAIRIDKLQELEAILDNENMTAANYQKQTNVEEK